MYIKNNICLDLEPYIDEVIEQSTERGSAGWQTLTSQHPSDVADLIEILPQYKQKQLLQSLPEHVNFKVFEHLSDMTQVLVFKQLDYDQAAHILQKMHANDVVDLLEHLSDDEVAAYLKLLRRKQRSHILSLLQFEPESAGNIMNSDVLTLHNDMTVKKSIGLIQKVSPHKDITYRIYVVDSDDVLVGYITLDKLVLNKPETPLSQLIKKEELTINCHEDQESAVARMSHYRVPVAPVLDDEGHFIGVLTPGDMVEVLEQEASEDAYKMSGVGEVRGTYFETPLRSMFFERTKWLVSLLFFQSFSSFIMNQYEAMLAQHVIISLFLTMLIGTGGNAGNQSATLVVRGIATGEIPENKKTLLLFREFLLSICIAALLSILSFARVYITHADAVAAAAISVSLFVIVITSMLLGTALPLMLERFNIDPAHSAAPFLATVMDIIGITIYCTICSYIL